MGENIVRAFLLPINITGTIILGIYSMLWGLWVANPFWDVFSRAPLFDSMAAIAPEVVWGSGTFIAGLCIVVGVLKKHYKMLMVSSAVTAWVWGAIAIFYFLADWMNTGGITSLMITSYALFIYLNIKINYVDVEVKQDAKKIL